VLRLWNGCQSLRWQTRLGRQAELFQRLAVKAQQLRMSCSPWWTKTRPHSNKVMDAFALPKDSAEEKKARSAAIEEATKYAAEIPLKVMEAASKSYEILSEMAEKGNPASISDVGVGIWHCAPPLAAQP